MITFFLEKGQTIEEIAAAIPFYDEATGKQQTPEEVRGWYEQETAIRKGKALGA